MAKFKKIKNNVPTNVGTITLTLQDHAIQGLVTSYKIDINTEDGALVSREIGELNEFLTQGQVNQIESLLNDIRIKSDEFMQDDPVT